MGDFSGTLTRLLLEHADALLGPGGADHVCRLAGEDRPSDRLRRNDERSSYEQFRRLAEAVAAVSGGPAALEGVGRSAWDAGSNPEVADGLQALGSPDAVLELIGAVASHLEGVVETTPSRVGDGEWVVARRFVEGVEPFPEHCAFAAGLLGHVPTLFGLAGEPVVEERCALRGDAECTFRVRWDTRPAPSGAAELVALEVRARVLESRLASIEETVGELVSGEPLDVVLDRIVTAASRALPGLGFVLALEDEEHQAGKTLWHGILEPDALACAAALRAGEQLDGRWQAVDVASRRARYGRLAAVGLGGTVQHHQHLVLSAYGRLAAAALDSASMLAEARRQADIASELLRLSQSLAEIGTTEEVARRLAAAVPSLIDCDQVIISLHDPEASVARLVAVDGYGEAIDRQLEGGAVPLDATFMDLHAVRILTSDDELSAVERRLIGKASALASVPLHAGGELLGWVAVVVQEDPARLLDEVHLGERLRGLAGQGATAIRNARLLDQMRYQAEHDPLTGLANQRLLELHATHAIARARRDDTRVGLLFLDLDDFKDVNDTLGHAEGDVLLQLVTERLRGVLREVDTVARFGGDEFVVLLPGLAGDGSAVVDKIMLAMTERFLIAGRDVHVSTSIGTAVFPDDGDDFGELLKRADIRMYEAKLGRRPQPQARPSST